MRIAIKKYFKFYNSKADAIKCARIAKFPEILVISLNRFEFNFVKMTRDKIQEQFDFPLELNIEMF